MLLAAVGSIFQLPAADPPKPDADKLARDLGSPVFATRDKASRELWKLGESARSALEMAARSADPEAARRAADILEKFDWGVFPDTPVGVLKQIKEYRSDDATRQRAAITALLAGDDRGLRTLGLLIAHDLEAERRTELFAHLLEETRRRVPLLLFHGEPERAERMLELGTAGPDPEAYLDYATFMAQRGRLKVATAFLEKAAAGRFDRATASGAALAVVLHFTGRSTDALKRLGPFATKEPLDGLLASLQADAGAWEQLLAEREEEPDSPGLRLFLLRKAGDQPKVAELVVQLKAQAAEAGSRAASVATALFLNERPQDGLAVLLKKKSAHPRLLGDVLSARWQFKECLAVDEDLPVNIPAGSDEDEGQVRLLYDVRRARVLSQLGRKAESVELFNSLAQFADPSGTFLRDLLRAELRAGRPDLAAEHAGQILGTAERRDTQLPGVHPDPFELLFEDDADAARVLWYSLRRAATGDNGRAGANVRLIRELLAGRVTPEQLRTVQAGLADLRKIAPDSDLERPEGVAVHQALAAIARAAGDPGTAERELRAAVKFRDDPSARAEAKIEKAVLEVLAGRLRPMGPRAWMFDTDETFKVWVDLGELLADAGRHAEAAKVFEAGWRQYPNNPILLWLSGRSLVAAGVRAEGERRIKLSHEVPLGDAQQRGRFLYELCERGELADMRTERDWTRRCAWHWTPSRGNVWNQLARASYILGDYAAAADAIERNLHYLLRTPDVSFVDGSGYLTVPANVRAFRAQAALADGRVAEAFATSKEVLQLLPGHTDFLTAVVPEFDRRGARKEADELFRLTWEPLQKLIRENPDSGWANATAAVVAAGCRRELDAAVAHAKKAVDLEPDVRGHQEALAEVHFRRGDRAAALVVMAKLRKLDHRSPYYKRLAERYRTADVTAPVILPPEVD